MYAFDLTNIETLTERDEHFFMGLTAYLTTQDSSVHVSIPT